MESRGTDLDGLRAQARETGGIEFLPARKARGSFSLVVGNTGVLSNVKYVITLDTDISCRAIRRASLWEPWHTR